MSEFSITSLINLARKNWGYLVATILVCAVIAYCMCSFVLTPTYQTKVSFVATNGGVGATIQTSDKIISTDVAASLAMVGTYVDILKTTNLYKELSKQLNDKYTPVELKNMIEVKARDEESLFVDVFVTSEDPAETIKIANKYLEIGEQYVSNSMNEPDKVLIIKVEESSTASQNYPNTPFTMFMAAFLGFAVVYAIIVIVFVMDKTIKGEQDFTQNYDIPVLGNVPNFKVAAREEKRYER